MSTAQGQFTIIDYNDALTLTGYIGSNLAKTQMYNPDNGSYNPDWASTNLVLHRAFMLSVLLQTRSLRLRLLRLNGTSVLLPRQLQPLEVML